MVKSGWDLISGITLVAVNAIPAVWWNQDIASGCCEGAWEGVLVRGSVPKLQNGIDSGIALFWWTAHKSWEQFQLLQSGWAEEREGCNGDCSKVVRGRDIQGHGSIRIPDNKVLLWNETGRGGSWNGVGMKEFLRHRNLQWADSRWWMKLRWKRQHKSPISVSVLTYVSF